MSIRMKPHPLVLVAVVGLFLYWVVQDPVGAAAMINGIFDATLSFLQLIANRIVQFLSALV